MSIPRFVRAESKEQVEAVNGFFANELSCHQALSVYILVMLSQGLSILGSWLLSKEGVKEIPPEGWLYNPGLLCPVPTRTLLL